MPNVFASQFVIDHHRLIYTHGEEDGYAFSINTVTGKLESACFLPPKEVVNCCNYWGQFQKLQETRQVTFKVTPLRALPYRLSWNTSEMLPNAARAMWNKRNTLDKPIKCVSAWVEGGMVVKYAPNDGMSDPMTHPVFAAGYGGVWLPMKYAHTCPVYDRHYPSIRDIEVENAEA